MGKPARAKAPVRPSLRRIPFSITIEGARDVVVTGNFTSWSASGIRLVRGESSEWQTVLELLPGEYEYRIVVDGTWSDHPKGAKRVPNGFGGTNCVLVVA